MCSEVFSIMIMHCKVQSSPVQFAGHWIAPCTVQFTLHCAMSSALHIQCSAISGSVGAKLGEDYQGQGGRQQIIQRQGAELSMI